MIVVLEHWNGAVREQPPLTWVTDRGAGISVSCKNGHLAYLDHTVGEHTGLVSPSLVCPEVDCGWHEYGLLKDYKGG